MSCDTKQCAGLAPKSKVLMACVEIYVRLQGLVTFLGVTCWVNGLYVLFFLVGQMEDSRRSGSLDSFTASRRAAETDHCNKKRNA